MQRWLRFPERGSRLGARRQARLSGGRAWVVLATLALGTFAGCDADSFMPPRPEELRAAGGGVPDAANARVGLANGADALAGSAPAVELLLDRRDADEAEIVTSAVRTQAGIDRTKLKIHVLEVQDLPARQAELIREALARNPRALIIEPSDPADRGLAEAVRDARSKGVPVVMLERPLEGAEAANGSSGDSKAATPGQSDSSSGKTAPLSRRDGPLVLVTAQSFAPFSKQLVESAMRNAKNAKLDPQGGAIILVNTSSDIFVNDRIAALRQALSAAGVKTIEQVAFAKQIPLGKALLTERLKAQPKISLVFAVDSLSATTCREANTDLVENRPFIMAAFASESHISDLTRVGDMAGVAEFAPLKVIRKAVNIASAIAQGKEVPSRVELPIIYYDSPANSGVAVSAARYKKMQGGTK
jgi:ABC-type sugar transport system substrate-binding protein